MIVKVSPRGSLDQLSQLEVNRLKQNASSELYRLFRKCSLAVLQAGIKSDSVEETLIKHKDFDISITHRERGIQLELVNPPQRAFVDGTIIRGIQEHLFAVLRDILHQSDHLSAQTQGDTAATNQITNNVFYALRNANIIQNPMDPSMVVCWGGHSINDTEYHYTRQVGYELGLRDLHICTGCGPGAMEGPMKGAAIGHAKQRVSHGRFIGLTEPSIIAAEPPNSIVNELVIMPDIEKRLEAFVRIGHGIIIFPGGAGTAEELLYLLGIMLDSNNEQHPLPLVLTGPKESAEHFREIDQFIQATLGPEAQCLYKIIIDDPAEVGRLMKQGMMEVRAYRKLMEDSYQFNWTLKIDDEFQQPFEPTHENMAELDLSPAQPKTSLAANLRRAFSGIVAGNVKQEGIDAINKHGPFQLNGDPVLMEKMDRLLQGFVDRQRMKLPGTTYVPCYEIHH